MGFWYILQNDFNDLPTCHTCLDKYPVEDFDRCKTVCHTCYNRLLRIRGRCDRGTSKAPRKRREVQEYLSVTYAAQLELAKRSWFKF